MVVDTTGEHWSLFTYLYENTRHLAPITFTSSPIVKKPKMQQMQLPFGFYSLGLSYRNCPNFNFNTITM